MALKYSLLLPKERRAILSFIMQLLHKQVLLTDSNPDNGTVDSDLADRYGYLFPCQD
jgi:hypothetical protein